jgi:hypothetical protein
MSLGRASKNGVRLGHRTKFDAESVKATMGLAHEKFAKYKEMAEFIGSKKFSMEALIQYYNTVFPNTSRTETVKEVAKVEDLSRNARLCLDVLETQPGAEFAQGTWWQALNSVTYVTDHIQGRNADNRLHSQWFGSNQARKLLAANTAVELANVA